VSERVSVSGVRLEALRASGVSGVEKAPGGGGGVALADGARAVLRRARDEEDVARHRTAFLHRRNVPRLLPSGVEREELRRTLGAQHDGVAELQRLARLPEGQRHRLCGVGRWG